MLRGRDTSLAAHQVQLRAYRDMGPEARVRLAFEMSEDARAISRGGIARRHPDYGPEEIQRAFIALLHGVDVARKLWPGIEIPTP